MGKRTRFGCALHYLLILIAASIIIGVCYGNYFSFREIPKAHHGVLDLRGWNFERQGSLSLNGEWQFYWKQLLTPADFATGRGGFQAPKLTGIIRVPGCWSGYQVKNKELTGDGYATYRLLLLVPDNCRRMGLDLPQFYTAYQLWVNGRLVASVGKVGRSRASMTPQYLPKVVACRPTNGRLELVVRVSNFYHRRGGIWRPIRLGQYEQVKRQDDLVQIFGVLVLVSFGLMAFYNLNLYFYLQKDRAPLLLAIFFGIATLRSILVGSVFYTRIFPNFSWELAMKLEYFTFYFCGPVFYGMTRCFYPTEIPSGFIRVLSWIAYIFAGITILAPASVYTHLAPVFQVILLGSVVYMTIILGRVALKHREYSMISVFAVIFLSLFNDVLFYNGLLRAEFPTIPIVEGLINLPFFHRRFPFGLISMLCFVGVFNMLTLKMIHYYFLRSGLKLESQSVTPLSLETMDLSPRETELINYVILGYSNKQIATELSISVGTVKTHLHHIFQKTGVKNRTELSHLLQKQ